VPKETGPYRRAVSAKKAAACAGIDTVRVVLEGGKMVVLAGTETTLPCELVLLAMGFVGPERHLASELGLALDARVETFARMLAGATSAQGSSPAATPRAGSLSSFGRLPMAAGSPPGWTRGCEAPLWLARPTLDGVASARTDAGRPAVR
jgi:hypothetical protein